MSMAATYGFVDEPPDFYPRGNMMGEWLLIGGSHHGRFQEWRTEAHTVVLPRMNEAAARMFRLDEVTISPEMEVDEYHIQKMATYLPHGTMIRAVAYLHSSLLVNPPSELAEWAIRTLLYRDGMGEHPRPYNL